MPDSVRGFEFLKEMTKEQLIDEILDDQCSKLKEFDLDSLRANVINLRVETYRKRLIEESGLKVQQGMFGTQYIKDDEDEE